MITFSDYRFAVERQPLVRPFRFKGGAFTEKWINVVRLLPDAGVVEDGAEGTGFTAIGGNAVLWSDARVFRDRSETGGNVVMTLLAEEAVKRARGQRFADPIEAFGALRDGVLEDARRLTGRPDVAPTFALNAMVALDLALWKLHAASIGSQRFVDLIPEELRPAFPARTETLARAPLISYNVPVAEICDLVRKGHQVLKVKLGQEGPTDEMIAKDAARLTEIHRAVARQTDDTRFYLDANGRYPDLDALHRLIDAIDGIGMLPRVIILEEPFPYETRIDVSGLPVRVAADESLHDASDLAERLDLGYGALALKPVGKTLSLSILMAAEAARRGTPCFVADSAGVPLMVDWNRLFAAHLPAFPGLDTGLLESNGAQNYGNWAALQGELPFPDAEWREPTDGAYRLDREFFKTSGGVFRTAGHYEDLVRV